jgi:hypothetical protein
MTPPLHPIPLPTTLCKSITICCCYVKNNNYFFVCYGVGSCGRDGVFFSMTFQAVFGRICIGRENADGRRTNDCRLLPIVLFAGIRQTS